MARFTVIHTSSRGTSDRVDHEDFEQAIVEAGHASRGYVKTEILCHDDGKLIPLAEAQEMLRQHDADMEDAERAYAEFHERLSRDADREYDFMMRGQRRESQARSCGNDPGRLAELEREWADEDNQECLGLTF